MKAIIAHIVGGKSLVLLIAAFAALATSSAWAGDAWIGAGADEYWGTPGNLVGGTQNTGCYFSDGITTNGVAANVINTTVRFKSNASYGRWLRFGRASLTDPDKIWTFIADQDSYGIAVNGYSLDIGCNLYGASGDGYLRIVNGTYSPSGGVYIGQSANDPTTKGVLDIGSAGHATTLTVSGSNGIQIRNGDLIATNTAVTCATLKIASVTGGTGTFTLNGGTVSVTNDLYIAAGENSTGTMTINGGTVNILSNNLYTCTGKNSTGTLTINGGTVEVGSSYQVLPSRNTGTTDIINLNGGVLKTKRIAYYRVACGINFNGGTLQANADSNTDFIKNGTAVNVGVGGGTIDNGGFLIKIPATLSGSGGLTFTGTGTTTLSDSVSYSGKTAVTPGTTLAVENATAKSNILSNGLVLAGLPTADQTVMTYTSDLTGVDLSKVTCPLAPTTTFKVGGDGNTAIVVDNPGPTLDNYWTGEAGDGNLSNAANWKNGVPTSGNANIFCATPVTLTKGATFAPSSITFLEGSAVVTITGDTAITGIAAVTNLSSVVQEIACPLTFAGNYRVHCATQPMNFAGGATATYPASDMTDNAASHTLMGNITFTADWAQGTVAYPYTVPNGSVLHGEDARGNDNSEDFLSIESGGKAYFKNVFVATGKSQINTEGELHVEGVISIGSPASGSYTHLTHNQNDNGVIYAGGIHKDNLNNTYIKVQPLYVGKDGLGTTDGNGNKMIYFANFDYTVYATDNFEIFGPRRSANPADWGLCLGKPVTFNTQGHTITWTAGADGGGALIKDGEGTLVFNPYGTSLKGTVTVEGGTLKVMSPTGVSTNAMTVKSGATLEIASGATLGESPVTLENGSTLKLTADGSTFTVLTNALTLPTGENEKAILRIDGARLGPGDHVLFTGVAADALDHVTVSLADEVIDGRKWSLKVEDGNLVLNIIATPGLMLIVK